MDSVAHGKTKSYGYRQLKYRGKKQIFTVLEFTVLPNYRIHGIFPKWHFISNLFTLFNLFILKEEKGDKT